jgi:hypothetical protein
MKRPIGVSILAFFFVGLAVYWLFSGATTVIAALNDTAAQAGGLFELGVAFLCGALGFGLWDLEEDARRAAIALFALPSPSVLSALSLPSMNRPPWTT